MSNITTPEQAFALVKKDAKVLFEYRGRVEQGDIIRIEDGLERKSAILVWLDGYQSRTDTVAIEDLLSVADTKGGEVHLSPFIGRGHLLPAGVKWLEDHPNT